MPEPAPIDALRDRAGRYTGRGINHDQQPFEGTLELSSVVSGKGLALTFTATGDDGTVYHEEHSVIGPGFDGALGLWTLCNNAPGMTALALRRDGEVEGCRRSLVFGVGDPDDEGSFREEIALDLHADGSLGYRFAWGLPGGEFAPRSGLRLSPA
jgi:hypothetical protein